MSTFDFAFMEYRAILQETPESPLAKDAQFAIGEYYFEDQNISEAVRTFNQFSEKPTGKIQDLLAYAYLLRCAKILSDNDSILLFENKLKQTLQTFESKKLSKFKSPIGHLFEFKELKDRVEIYRDNSVFAIILKTT